MEDHEIIALYWSRDETAIQETNNKYGRFCYSIALNILSVLEDAEECVSDTYHKVWNNIPPEKPIAFRAWLGRIVRNLSINRWHYNRAEKRYVGIGKLLSELSDCIPDPETTEDILGAQELTQYINDWLDTLADMERVLFVRRYWNGDKLKHLADIGGTSPNKLAGKMYRLRRSLSAYLTERGVAI